MSIWVILATKWAYMRSTKPPASKFSENHAKLLLLLMMIKVAVWLLNEYKFLFGLVLDFSK